MVHDFVAFDVTLDRGIPFGSMGPHTLRSRIVDLVLRSRRVQTELDIWRLYHVIYYYQKCGGNEIKVPKPPEISYRKQKQLIRSVVTKQLIATLSAMKASDSEVSRDDFSLVVRSTPERIPKPKTADIPGVALEGSVLAGTVLCFFPGTVYRASQLSQLLQCTAAHSPYLMSRTDGCVVDSSDYALGSENLRSNPLAVGHLVRHPVSQEGMNLLPYSYTLPTDFPPHLLPLVPSRYHTPPTWLQTKQLKTIVFVAASHIKNEELFLNYRLKPSSDVPDWYQPVSQEESARRWR